MPGVEFCFVVRKPVAGINEYLWEDVLANNVGEVDAVVHLAGLAHDTKNTRDDSEYYKVNFDLTKVLYDWFLKANATKFIYVSSVKAAADSVEGMLDENIKPQPVTAYGKSKLKAEEYIQQLSLGKDDKAYYILRPCMVHGPGNKGNLNLLYKFVQKGLPYPLGAFNNQRSFLSVDNFSFVCKQLLTQNASSGIYNLADDESLSTKELIELIAETIGKKASVWSPSKTVINMVAKTGDLLRLPINSERLDKLTENYVVSNRKIKSALGIEALPINAKEGLRKTIASFNG